MRRVNQSEITTFLRCPRKWNLGYLQGFGLPAESSNSKLATGTLTHSALKELYRGGVWGDVFDHDTPAEEWSDEENLAWIMMEGYEEWLENTGEDVDHEFILVEEALEVPITVFDPLSKDHVEFLLHGTPDLLSRTGGGTWLWDHKTVAQFGQFANRRLQFNYQLLTYSWMWLQVTGEVLTGAYLNMLRKVKRTAQAKPPFYLREPVQFSRKQIEGHGDRLKRDLQRMIMVEAMGHFDPVVDQDCTWKCDFEPACVMMDEGSYGWEMLNDLYVRRDDR